MSSNGGGSNLSRLQNAGLVDPSELDQPTRDAIKSLSEEEVDCLISAAEKLGVSPGGVTPGGIIL